MKPRKPRKPGRRSFLIWRQMDVRIIWWRWECSLCHPPAMGGRYGSDGWEKIVSISLPNHMRRRHDHHQWAAGRA